MCLLDIPYCENIRTRGQTHFGKIQLNKTCIVKLKHTGPPVLYLVCWLCTVTKLDPDLVIILESRFHVNDPKHTARRENLFSVYKIIDKVFKNTAHAWLSVLVKECHNFERMESLENETNSEIVIKLKLSNNKSHCIHMVSKSSHSIDKSLRS